MVGLIHRLTQMRFRISADMGQMDVRQDGSLEPPNREDEIDENDPLEIAVDEDEWSPLYSQTRIIRRQPISSFTRVIHSRDSKWRVFSTLGDKALWECPECKQLVWNDSEAIQGHISWHAWLDDQLGIEEEERPERNSYKPKVMPKNKRKGNGKVN